MGMVWTEEQISAYIDMQLPVAEQRALEADLARDAELRRRVTLLRETVALLQGIPLREPPRNYLLTPAMMGAPATKMPARARRGLLPLWLMRLATVASAAVFVLAVGLNLNPGLLPAVRAPEAVQREMADIAAVAEDEPVLYQEAPAEANATPVEEQQALSKTAPVPAPMPTDTGDAPAYGLGGFEEGYVGAPPGEGGVGGGGPEAERSFAPVAPETAATENLCDANGPENCAGVTAGLTMTLQVAESFSMTAPISGAAVPEVATLQADAVEQLQPLIETQETPPQPKSPIPLWVTALLGVSTVGLAYVTWNLSRRR